MSVVAVIVAVADNGVIGRDNALPWHLPEDLRYFKRVTMGKPLLMGRKTYESIGRPLPGRTNIVITRDPAWQAPGVQVVHSLDDAMALGAEVAQRDDVDEMMVIGGAEIYAAVIPQARRLYLTRVHASVAGDAVLPEVDWSVWCKVSSERHAAGGDNPYDYSFEVYERS
ncbi:dihydrofolate reductase [Pseudohalioglobus sediminis]|uniref:Dihydrofolate reductase n=1 Tax=Pseudohalioglobus sediminis TaxID=2606449 RepID=A0A5B0WRM3_9GAMM|nr:dihydrofolate reductase [Pseudohalioglobus sediminis]